MPDINEEQGGGAGDWPPKIQTTNLVEPFWLSEGGKIPIKTIFILSSENSHSLTFT